ncbi:MAG: YraN family protein [Polyangiaceae bacterium]
MPVFRGNDPNTYPRPGIVGAAAEDVVCDYLKNLGCEILGRNVRVGHLEIDLVARMDEVALIVEVRTRGEGAWTSAFGSVTATKRRNVRRAGERLWDRRLKHDERLERLRFDTASVTFDQRGHPSVEYVPGAF